MTDCRFEPFIQDYREVRDLLALTGMWGEGACEQRLKSALDASDAILAARCPDGTLAGIARTLTDNAIFIFLAMLVVHPNHQGQGLGRELVTRIMAPMAGQRAMTTIVLSEADATSFYERLGFKTDMRLMAQREF